ncbi:guanine nucleotide binding protein, alpha subunit [Entophlyctis helioformis]|nr:guanine nucleotide binding protein, alpha subunit [Entophlyctis helioformis]
MKSILSPKASGPGEMSHRRSASAEERARSRDIDTLLAKDKQDWQRLVQQPRVLVLGSGDCGKTTFMKQLRILHGGGYEDFERMAYRKYLVSNIRDGATALIAWATGLGMDKTSTDLASHIQTVMDYYTRAPPNTTKLPQAVAKAIESIWSDAHIKEAVLTATPSELSMQDTGDYFLSQAATFANDQYIPTNQDILNIRVPTTQITETVFNISGKPFHFYDCGGQQKYRKAWTQYFDKVQHILFLTSLASYDQMLVEDPTVNRMTDAITLFGEICNHPLLNRIPVALFMNKKDLFEKKMATSDIAKHFPDYENLSPEKRVFKYSARFFEKKFIAAMTQGNGGDRGMFIGTYLTCCTDTNVMAAVIKTVLEALVRGSLKDVGLV